MFEVAFESQYDAVGVGRLTLPALPVAPAGPAVAPDTTAATAIEHAVCAYTGTVRHSAAPSVMTGRAH